MNPEKRPEIIPTPLQTALEAVDAVDPALFRDSDRAAEEVVRRLEMALNQELAADVRGRIFDVVKSTTAVSENVDVELLKSKLQRTLEGSLGDNMGE